MSADGSISLTRSKLYEMIWTEPTRTVAAKLGISDVGLAKVCRKYRIPRPYRGYWREKETGHKPRQAKLLPWPKHLGPEPEAITFRAVPDPATPSAPTPPELESIRAQQAYEANPDHSIHVAADLTDADRLVRRAHRLLKRTWERNLLSPSDRPCLDIHVTKESLDRALRIFDAIIKAVRARGWTIETDEKQPWLTIVTALDERVAIGITEKTKQIEIPKDEKERPGSLLSYRTYDYKGSGLLSIRVADGPSFSYGALSWNDGKVQRLEDLLSDVMIGLVRMAERKKAFRREQERRERERREEEHRQYLAAQRREREKDRREELKVELDGWVRSQQVREYLRALEEASKDHLQQAPDGRLARWIRWARQYADRIDPLRDLEHLPYDPEGYGRPPLDLSAFGLAPPPDA